MEFDTKCAHYGVLTVRCAARVGFDSNRATFTLGDLSHASQKMKQRLKLQHQLKNKHNKQSKPQACELCCLSLRQI